MTQVITKDELQTAEITADDAKAAVAAAEAGFASVDNPEAKQEKPEPVVAKTETVVDPKVEKEAADKVAADAEWDGVPVKVRTTLEQISGRVGALDKIEHRLKGVEGRTGAALEGVHALKLALETATTVKKAGGEAPTQAQIAEAAASEERWDNLKADFPEWAAGTDLRIEQKLDERLAKFAPPAVDVAGLKTELTGSMSEIVAKVTSSVKAETRELAKIDRKYETWETDIFTNGVDDSDGFTSAFAEWHNAQPPEIRALGRSDKASDAIKMLDGFYAHRKAVAEATARAEKNKQRLEKAITPKGVVSATANRTLTEEEAKYQAFASVDT